MINVLGIAYKTSKSFTENKLIYLFSPELIKQHYYLKHFDASSEPSEESFSI